MAHVVRLAAALGAILALAGCGPNPALPALESRARELEQEKAALEEQVDLLQRNLDETLAELEAQHQANREQADALSQAIQLRFPFVVWSKKFPEGIRGDGGPEAIVYLELLQGNFDTTSQFWFGVWRGTFRFRTVFPAETLNSRGVSQGRYSPMAEEAYLEGLPGEVLSEPMYLTFPEEIDFQFSDYNADGLPDFVISQFGALSAGDYCGVFTLRESGLVELLPVYGDKRAATLFGLISAEEGAGGGPAFFYPYYHGVSPLLETAADHPGFTVRYRMNHGLEVIFMEEGLQAFEDYQQRHLEQYGEPAFYAYTGLTAQDTYLWKDTHFELVRQEVLEIGQ